MSGAATSRGIAVAVPSAVNTPVLWMLPVIAVQALLASVGEPARLTLDRIHARREGAVLQERFGPAWRAYAARVRRWR